MKYAECTPGLTLCAIIVLSKFCFRGMYHISVCKYRWEFDVCTYTNRLLPLNVAFSLPMIHNNHYQDMKFIPFKNIFTF